MLLTLNIRGRFEMLKLHRAYSCIFQDCTIRTVALPAAWWVQLTGANINEWPTGDFPAVDRTKQYRYIADGQKYLILGSDSFVGDRSREGEETWEPEVEPDFVQPGDDDDGIMSEDADHDSIKTGDEQEAYARSLALARSQKKTVPDTEDRGEDDVEEQGQDDIEGSESDDDPESLPTVYVSCASGDMAPFLTTLYEEHYADTGYPDDITHLSFDLEFDGILNSGMIEKFGIDVDHTDIGKPPSTITCGSID
jgi:hypothetical protein